MNKRRYNVMLNPDSVEVLQAHLKTVNMSLSAFLTKMIDEAAKDIQGQPVKLGEKKLQDLTIKEFGELMQYWYKTEDGESCA